MTSDDLLKWLGFGLTLSIAVVGALAVFFKTTYELNSVKENQDEMKHEHAQTAQEFRNEINQLKDLRNSDQIQITKLIENSEYQKTQLQEIKALLSELTRR